MAKTILQAASMKGGFSDEVASCEYYKWFMNEGGDTFGYWASDMRTPARDRIIEAYLKSQGAGSNAIAMLLSGKENREMMKDVTEETSLRDFLDMVKKHYPSESPLPVLIDILRACDIPVKHVSNEVQSKHVTEVEEGIKILVRLRQGGKRQPLSFEGLYQDTSDGHNKFWEVKYISNNLFRAGWGRIENYPNVQDHKDYTEAEASTVARKKITQGNYVKVR